MDFCELAYRRYSVRAYKSDPIEDEKLHHILAAARLAPTAANRQPFRLYVIETARHAETLKRLYHRDWFVQAPLVCGIAAVLPEGWTRRFDGVNYAVVDAAIAFDHLILQAADLGIGACWIAAFDPAVARELLALPDGWQPVAFTPIGYPTDEWREKIRRPADELVTYL
ncbi:nitroreductase family protein [candidate division KSB1 bacterium]|nr:nitroreductase family protein [candidate division KSB1 bacterium]RQW08803.1 MAG: nitroreductase [candidate division KSB1 bacterium]